MKIFSVLRIHFIAVLFVTLASRVYAQEIFCSLPDQVIKAHGKIYPIKGGGNKYFKIYRQPKLEGLIDSTGKFILPASFKYIGNIANGYVTARLPNDAFVLINLSTGRRLPLPYQAVSPDILDGTITVKHNNAPQLIDLKNNILIPSGKFQSLADPSEGLLPVLKNGLYGFADYRGNVVIPCKYYYVDSFYKGRAIVYAGNKDQQLEGMVDKQGNELLKPIYKRLLMVEENISVQDTSGKIAVFNKEGNRLTSFIYSHIYDDTKDDYVIASRDGADFLMNSEGKEMFKSEYLGLNKDNGIAGPVKNGYIIAHQYNSDGQLKYGVLKFDGSIVLPLQYDFLDGFGQTELVMLPARTEKYGSIDYQGSIVLQPKYDEVLLKAGKGYVVRLDEKIGVVDQKGKILIPFLYDALADDQPMCLLSLRKGTQTHYYDLNFTKQK